MTQNKISVITAVYNNKKFILEALKSFSKQTYHHKEQIIIDGGSTDGTLELIKKNLTKEMLLISEKDRGIYDALNKGIKYASGDIVGFLHSDDLFATKEALSLVAQEFSEKKIEACYSDLVYIAQKDPKKTLRYWKSSAFSLNKIKKGWMPPHPTFYMKKNSYQKMNGFQIKYKIAADYDACLRYLWKYKINCSYIPQVLIKMRTGGASNRSIKNIIQKSKEDYQIIKENNVGGLPTLIMKNLSKFKQFF